MERIFKFFAKRPLRFWIMVVGVIIALMCFEEVVDDVFYDPGEGDHEAESFDRSIAEFVNGYRTPRLNQAMTDLTALGSISVIFTLYIIFVSVLGTFRDFKGVIFLTIVLGGAGLWPYFLKLYFARERPGVDAWLVQVSDLSFPSGHSFGAAATYIGFSYYASQHARSPNQEIFFYALGAFLAFLVGASRIYLGVHHSTDVLAGLSGGVAWAFLAALIFEVYGKSPKEEPKRLSP